MARSELGRIVGLAPLAVAMLTDCSSTASNKRGQEPAEGGVTNGSGGALVSGGASGSGVTTGGTAQSGSTGAGAPGQAGASTGGSASGGTSDVGGESGSGGSAGESLPVGTGGSEGGSTSEPQGGAPAAGSDGEGGEGGEAGASGGALCTSDEPLEVSEAAGRSQVPRAVWTGNGYGIVWHDDRDGNPEIYFARLDAEGSKIGDDVRITEAPGESAAPSIVWASSEFGLTWHDDRDGNTEIYFARVGPSGTKLGDEIPVTDDVARSEFPSLAPAAGGYAVAWNDDRDGQFQIYVALLDGAGVKLAPEERVSGETTLAASPSLARGPGGFGVAWYDLRDDAGLQIYFAGLDEDGIRIGDDFRLSALDSGGGTPSVASTGSSYAVAWADGVGIGGEVYWVSVADDLSVDGDPLVLSSSGATAWFPALISSADGYAIAWPDGRDGDSEIYVQELDELGGKLGEEVRVSDDATGSLEPTLTASITGYGVAWLDDPTETTGEVLFTRICR